jgi:hypothetical protein
VFTLSSQTATWIKERYILLKIHPIIQFIGTVCAFYVFFLGISRFRSQHLGHKALFKWKQHVFLGIFANILFICGLFGGLAVVYLNWEGILITGFHGTFAFVILPFFLFGSISGIYMNRVKKKRKFLPLLHGISNSILLILVVLQARSGYWVYKVFVLGE